MVRLFSEYEFPVRNYLTIKRPVEDMQLTRLQSRAPGDKSGQFIALKAI
jgi:hypothetical protein